MGVGFLMCCIDYRDGFARPQIVEESGRRQTPLRRAVSEPRPPFFRTRIYVGCTLHLAASQLDDETARVHSHCVTLTAEEATPSVVFLPSPRPRFDLVLHAQSYLVTAEP
jgi:hypothetical protein